MDIGQRTWKGWGYCSLVKNIELYVKDTFRKVKLYLSRYLSFLEFKFSFVHTVYRKVSLANIKTLFYLRI